MTTDELEFRDELRALTPEQRQMVRRLIEALNAGVDLSGLLIAIEGCSSSDVATQQIDRALAELGY
jgi:hypothetical protein